MWICFSSCQFWVLVALGFRSGPCLEDLPWFSSDC
jgi:hypothetical protein